MSDTIKLNKSTKEDMMHSIKSYFSKERDEHLGDLGAYLILEFIIEKLGPQFYNQGIEDAYSCMAERIDGIFELKKVIKN